MTQQIHPHNIIKLFEPFTHTTINVKRHKKHIQIQSNNTYTYPQKINNNQESILQPPTPIYHNRASNTPHAITTTDDFYCPMQTDSLFWCIYIIQNGELEYEMLNKGKPISMSILTTLKINCVENIRKTYKENVKPYKLSTLENIETSLVHTPCISISTAVSLCASNNHNLCFISSKHRFFYLLECNPNISTWYIIKREENNNKNNKKCNSSPLYSYKQVEQKKLIDYTLNMIQITNLNTPLKSISFYKLDDLLNMNTILQLPLVDTNTNKQFKKKDLYEQVAKIVQPNVFSAA